MYYSAMLMVALSYGWSWNFIFTLKRVDLPLFTTGRPESPVQPSSRVLMSCYWIFTITIIAAYSANLIAVLTVQKHRLPIDSLEELAAHPEYQAGVNDGAVLSELFKVGRVYFIFFLKFFLVRTHPHVLFWASGTPVCDFWCRLFWVSKTEWVRPFLHYWGESNVHFEIRKNSTFHRVTQDRNQKNRGEGGVWKRREIQVAALGAICFRFP